MEWIYTGGAILVGYIVIIAIMILAAILCTVSDKVSEKIKIPNWVHTMGKVILFLLLLLFSVIFAYGIGDITIQRFIV
jgi:hypothetical protein